MSQKKIDLKEEDRSSPEGNSHTIVAVTMILLIVCAGAIVLLTQFYKTDNKSRSIAKIAQVELPEKKEVKGEQVEEEPKETTYSYEIEPAFEGANFFEELLPIKGQNAYIAHPLTIEKEAPPAIIIYSHGSITQIADNMENKYMSEFIRGYGEYFTSSNFVFAASNQHGENWGNQESVMDTQNLINYVKDKYQTSGDVYMIGFSMGGLPTWEFITQYPENVRKVALLAGTSYYWNHPKEEIDAISDIDIMIWHGNLDESVPLSMSQNMVNHAKKYDKNISLVVLNGVDHWGVDEELKEEILSFFQE